MSMQVIEGWDWLPQTNSLDPYLAAAGWWNYRNSPVEAPITGRFGFGKAFHVTGDWSTFAGYAKFFKGGGTSNEGFFACAMYRDDSTFSGPAIGVRNIAGGGNQLIVAADRFGILKLKLNDTYTVTAQSDPEAFFDRVWFNLECYYKIHNTSGEVEVRVNGKTVIHAVDIDTQSLGVDTVDCLLMGGSSATSGAQGTDHYIDDVAAWDTTGTTCNTWLGTNRVKTQLMIADGTNIDSTIGGSAPAATHWQSVRNAAFNDAQYVYLADTQVGDYDLYDLDPNLSADIVHSVQVRLVARQDDATQMTIRSLIESGGVIAEGTDVNLNQTYAHYYDLYDLDPSGSAWTLSTANGAQAGFKLQAVEV